MGRAKPVNKVRFVTVPGTLDLLYVTANDRRCPRDASQTMVHRGRDTDILLQFDMEHSLPNPGQLGQQVP